MICVSINVPLLQKEVSIDIVSLVKKGLYIHMNKNY